MTQTIGRASDGKRLQTLWGSDPVSAAPETMASLRITAALCVLGFLAVAIAGILLRPLAPIDETRYVAVAWEMYLSGDYLVPTKNFALYAHKPPLLFWSINALWAMFGVSDFAARIVGPLYAVVALLLTGRVAAQLWPDDPQIGPRAVILLSGFAAFAILGGLTMFDAMLTVAVLLGLLALLKAVDTGAARWWLALGAALALGVLAKGPVILLHLGPVILSVPFWASSALTLRQLAKGMGLALAVALALVALWVVPAVISGGQDYRDAILWTQTAGRISNSFAHARPWWFLLALLPVLLFPWLWMPEVWSRARQANWRDPGLRLCAVWAGAALVGFSLISGKQPHYLLPELASVALIVARLTTGVRLRLGPAVLPVLALAAFAALVAVGAVSPGSIGEALTPRPVVLAWALCIIALCWFCLRIGGLRGGLTLSLGLVLACNLLIGMTGLRQTYDTAGIAAAIAPSLPAGVAFYGQDYNAEFNFAGRFTAPLALPQDRAALTTWMQAHPQGIIVARTGRPDLGWPAQATLPFRGVDYGIWHVAGAGQQ